MNTPSHNLLPLLIALLLLLALALFAWARSRKQSKFAALAPELTYRVVARYPHDPSAYTQGLIYRDGSFFEGTGLRGESTLRKVEIPSGRVLLMHKLEDQYFGEGITEFGGKLYQLTWQEHTGFIYNPATLRQIGTFSYPTEGWGLTHYENELVMSDGTDKLYFLDPETLETKRSLQVTRAGHPIVRMNELENIQGTIWANIWMTDTIVRIDPSTGHVLSVLDLAGLRPEETFSDPAKVLNGIAYDAEKDRLFVTGKQWNVLYELEMLPKTGGLTPTH